MSKQKVKVPGSRIVKKNTLKPDIIEKPKVNKRKNVIYLLTAIILTSIVYSSSLKNGWVRNWDDNGYVLDYQMIHKLTARNIAQIFSSFNNGNYHPLTNLSHAADYKLASKEKDKKGNPPGDPNPFIFHLSNLIFHLLNVFLVFTFVKLITKKVEIAAITAILFGIHPMHVESIAWVSERKDVLYSLFFLVSMIYYYYFLNKKEGKTKYYFLSLAAFLLSCLSKSAAVTLPVVLLLIDYYLKRRWTWKIVFEKIPFFVLSFIFGVVAIYSQKSTGSIQDIAPLFKWFERPLLVGYSSLIYLFKLIVPIHLAAMYPYPDLINGHLPLIFYIAPLVILGLFFLVYYSRKFNREIIFGVLFFFVTISLMLQFLPVGGALMAERYTYIPYIGLFMIIGKGYVYSQENKSKFAQNIKWLYTTIIVAGIIAFSVLSFQRIKVWKDGETLFTDVIKKYPNLPFAYNNRGYLYYNFMRKYDKSLADYNKCISLDSTFHRAYSNRGVLYYNTGRLDLAVKDFTKAIHFKNDNTDAWIGRANSYSTLKKFDLALPDYNHYISIVANDSKSYLWRGIALYNLGRFDESFTDINKCLNITTDNDNAYLWRGILFSQKKDYKAAIKGFDQSIELNSNQTEPYIWRGIARDNLKQYTAAIDDYSKGLKKCYKDTTKIFLIKDDGNSQKIDTLFNNPSSAATIFLNRSAAYFALKKYTEAFKDYCAAGDLGLALNKDYFFKLKALAGK